MSRPHKRRHVCSLPVINRFGPLGNQNNNNFVIMSVDEYETIRLIDYERLNQEECAEQMQVARTTIQGIYNDARKKIADTLVNGKVLTIEGGSYKICHQYREYGRCRRGCRKFHLGGIDEDNNSGQ